MRTSTTFLMLVALVLCAVSPMPVQAQQPGALSFEVAGTDAEHVHSFLKSLQTAVAIDNRIKVASMMRYPLAVWIDGAEVTLRNPGDLQARYTKVFDVAMRKTIADARPETLQATAQGVMIEGGRLCCVPEKDRHNVIKIVSMGKPE